MRNSAHLAYQCMALHHHVWFFNGQKGYGTNTVMLLKAPEPNSIKLSWNAFKSIKALYL